VLPAKRILIVDDEILIRQVNAGVLSRHGYQTETAENGEVAWEALQANTFDLLITDNIMPKVSGLELVKKLRAAHISLPIIFLSGAIPSEACDRLNGLQIAAALQKPVSVKELVGTVQRVLHTRARARGSLRWRAPQPLRPAIAQPHKHFAPRSWRRHAFGD
jgi:DNA-binding response OmpR family regulator